MALRTKTKNPESGAIKHRRHPRSGQEYSLLSIPLPEGGFIASIAQDQSFSATAPTRAAAEQAAEDRFLNAGTNSAAANVMSEEWLAGLDYCDESDEPGPAEPLSLETDPDSLIPWEQIAHRHGL